MTPEQTENLKKLAEAARLDSLYWWPVDELEDSNIILDKDDAAYIAAASPNVVLALIAENEAQAARIKELEAERDANFAAFHETCVISSRRGGEIDALRAALANAEQAQPTIQDALDAGDGLLHGTIDRLQDEVSRQKICILGMAETIQHLRAEKITLQQEAKCTHPTEQAKPQGDRAVLVAKLRGSVYTPLRPDQLNMIAADMLEADHIPDAGKMVWQPIETAPKDRTMFVVRGFSVEVRKGHHYDTDPYCVWATGDGFERWPHPFKPTHWIPLPAAPTGEQK